MLEAWAVAGIKRVRNAVLLARQVLESDNTFMIGEGADRFARARGIPLIDPRELITPEQLEKWEHYKLNPPTPQELFEGDTVGCAAVDAAGNVAAATSTGGRDFKMPGRHYHRRQIGARRLGV